MLQVTELIAELLSSLSQGLHVWLFVWFFFNVLCSLWFWSPLYQQDEKQQIDEHCRTVLEGGFLVAHKAWG